MKMLDPILQAQAVASLRETLTALGEGEDTALLLDMVEGETSFFEVCDRFLAQISDDQAMVSAIKEQRANLATRSERFAKRAEVTKAILEQAFLVADLPKVERPVGTLYLSNRAPKVIVETESDIPPRFWKAADPVLDGKALGDELKARREALNLILASGPGEARDAAVAGFHQQFLSEVEASELVGDLAALDKVPADEEGAKVRAATIDGLHFAYGSLPGATLSRGSRSLSIRTA